MKIRSVSYNTRKHAFEVATWRNQFTFPYSKPLPAPTTGDPISESTIAEDLGRESFTYRLASGQEGTVHIEQVLEYNQDPVYMRDLLLYKLTVEAQKRLE